MAFPGVPNPTSALRQPQLQRPLRAISERLQAMPEAQDKDRLKLSEEILEDMLHSGAGLPNLEQLTQALASDPGLEEKAAQKVGAPSAASPVEITVHWQPGHEPGKIVRPKGEIGIVGATVRETKDKKQQPPAKQASAPRAGQPARKPDRVELSPESKQQMQELRDSGVEEAAATRIERAAENGPAQAAVAAPEKETQVTEVPGQIACTKFEKWNQTAWIKPGGSFESKPGRRTLIRAFQNVDDQPAQVLRQLEPMQGSKVRELARDQPIPELNKHQRKRLADPEMEFK